MLEILTNWFGIVRQIFIMIDSVAFSLIDNAYSLYIVFAENELITNDTVVTVMNNMYVAIGIFALFRIALLLVNAMINPDKLNEKGNGLGNILTNLIIMFVLLVMTPMIFNEVMLLQQKVVKGNYIQKIFIKYTGNSKLDPAKEMQDIAISALIHPNEEVLKSGKNCDNENSKCGRALKDYEDMQANGFSFITLSHHIGTTVDTANEKDVYVYDYTILVTFAAGIFITYVLISFAFDVAVRAVELAVLEIVSPLFIATIVDPKSAKSGPFKNWLKAFGKTYLNLFIIIAAVSLLLLLLGLVRNINISGLGLIGKLVLLIAVLIFVKKLPKWFGGLLGIEAAGLGGLSIGKKIAGAALLGGVATKAARGVAGASAGLANNAFRNYRNTRALKKAAGISRAEKKKFKEDFNRDPANANRSFASAWSDKKKQIRKDNNLKASDRAIRNVAGAVAGVATGFGAGIKADKLTGAFKGGITASNQFGDKLGLQGKSLIEKGKSAFKGGYGSLIDAGYGTAAERYEAQEKLDKMKKRETWFTPKALKEFGGPASSKLVAGMGAFQAVAGEARDLQEAYAMLYANAKGYSHSREKDGTLVINDANGNEVELDKVVQNGRAMVGDEGAANIAKMFNTIQTNAVQELSQNKQYINQMNSSAGAVQSTIKEMEIKANSINIPDSVKIGGKITLPIGNNGAMVGFDNSAVGMNRLISVLETQIGNAAASGDVVKQKKLEAQKESAEKLLETFTNKETMENQFKQLLTQIEGLSKRNEILSPIVEKVGTEYKTEYDSNGIPKLVKDSKKTKTIVGDQERLSFLQNNATSIDKEVNYYKEKSEEKK